MGSSRTLTEQVRTTGTIPTNVKFNGCAIFTAKADFPVLLSDLEVDSTVPTTSANYVGGINGLLTQFGQHFRLVSWGVRFFNSLSATESSGQILIAKGSQPALSTTVSIDPNTYYAFESHPMKHGSEWSVVGNVTGSESMDWALKSSHSSAVQGPPDGYECIYVIVRNTKASAFPVYYETVYNYEFTISITSPMNSIAEQQPVYDPQLLVARNEHNNNAPVVHTGSREKMEQTLKREAKKAFTKHVLPALRKKGEQALIAALA